MAGGVVGQASITVGADASGLGSDVEKQSKSALSGVGAALGKTISDGLKTTLAVGGAVAGATLALSLIHI